MSASTKSPRITVCIPAYNRHEVLQDLLDSILSQEFNNYNVLICEDHSPSRQKIREIVQANQRQYPNLITYHENAKNLGYDGNLRNLVERADGEYCLFMGNDDIMCQGALSKVDAAIGRHPNIGVYLRSYAAFEGCTKNVVQTFRYFDKELFD